MLVADMAKWKKIIRLSGGVNSFQFVWLVGEEQKRWESGHLTIWFEHQALDWLVWFSMNWSTNPI
jgi:hypothetical protein